MIQSSTSLRGEPEKINLDTVGMTWLELRQAVLDSHKPIQHLFFKGLGNQLQFEDSEIAEGIMLHFSAMDAPALPILSSFFIAILIVLLAHFSSIFIIFNFEDFR